MATQTTNWEKMGEEKGEIAQAPDLTLKESKKYSWKERHIYICIYVHSLNT